MRQTKATANVPSNSALTDELARLLGARRTVRLRRLMRQTALPPEVLLAEVSPGDAPLLSEVAIVAIALPKKLRGMVDRITAGNRDSIVLVLESGRTVTWGSSSDSELKAQVARALLKKKPKSSIDVSSSHNPAVG